MDFHAPEDWKTKRKLLVKEVYGAVHSDADSLTLPSNKDMYEVRNLSDEDLGVRVFMDFVMSAQGTNTVSFPCEITELQDGRRFIWKLNPIFRAKVRQFLNQPLTVIHRLADIRENLGVLKRHIIEAGKFVECFLRETEKFLDADFKTLAHIATNHGQLYSISALQRLTQSLDEPLTQLCELIHEVVDGAHVSGTFFNLLLDRSKFCPGTFFSQIISNTMNSCLRLFHEWAYAWIHFNDLSADFYFEFPIWDLCKQSHLGTNVTMNDENPAYLQSVSFIKFGLSNDRTDFGKRFVCVPELCPRPFTDALKNLFLAGKYNYVMKTYLEKLVAPKLTTNPADMNTTECLEMIERTYQELGHGLLKLLNQKHDLWDLVEVLPAYFWGVDNNWLEAFVQLTESADQPGGLEVPRGAVGEMELKRVFDTAIGRAGRQLNATFASHFMLSIPPADTHDFWHHPLHDAAAEAEQRPRVAEMELDYDAGPAFSMVFPSTVAEPYRGLFRYAHALRRCIFVLLRLKLDQRWFCTLPSITYARSTASDLRERVNSHRVPLLVLHSMLQFFQNLYDFVFHQCVRVDLPLFLRKIRDAQHVAEFVELQQRLVDTIRRHSCSSENYAQLIRKVWFLVGYGAALGRGQLSFTRCCALMLKNVCKVKKWVLARPDDRHMTHMAQWLFGGNLHVFDDPDPVLALLKNLCVLPPPDPSAAPLHQLASNLLQVKTKDCQGAHNDSQGEESWKPARSHNVGLLRTATQLHPNVKSEH